MAKKPSRLPRSPQLASAVIKQQLASYHAGAAKGEFNKANRDAIVAGGLAAVGGPIAGPAAVGLGVAAALRFASGVVETSKELKYKGKADRQRRLEELRAKRAAAPVSRLQQSSAAQTGRTRSYVDALGRFYANGRAIKPRGLA